MGANEKRGRVRCAPVFGGGVCFSLAHLAGIVTEVRRPKTATTPCLSLCMLWEKVLEQVCFVRPSSFFVLDMVSIAAPSTCSLFTEVKRSVGSHFWPCLDMKRPT